MVDFTVSMELHNYDVYPKVFAGNTETEVNIKPLGDHVKFNKDIEYRVTVQAFNEGNIRDYPNRKNFPEYFIKPDADGIIRLKHFFKDEQQHFIKIWDPEEPKKQIVRLSVYSLNEDLVGRYPFYGDLHMHTHRSDGRQSPAVVCANYRKTGYDFFAITDHELYYPSLEAIDAYKDVPIEFNICPGEEIHMPWIDDEGNDVHIVNFGGNYSVNAIVEGEQTNEVGPAKELRSYKGADCPDVMTVEEYHRQVNELAKTLDIPEGIEPFTYAGCVWVFNHIKKANGLGIFAHPYWISNVLQVPENITDYMLKTHPFDAFEVLGGEANYEQNGFQTHKYYEILAQGYKFPIVGSTDSHSSVHNETSHVAATIVFSPENEKDAIIASIKDFYSVAVDGISKEFRLVGDFRLAKYACFLMQNFFPLHNELCYEEGRLMKDYVCGVEGAKETLEFISGRMKKQREKYFKF